MYSVNSIGPYKYLNETSYALSIAIERYNEFCFVLSFYKHKLNNTWYILKMAVSGATVAQSGESTLSQQSVVQKKRIK